MRDNAIESEARCWVLVEKSIEQVAHCMRLAGQRHIGRALRRGPPCWSRAYQHTVAAHVHWHGIIVMQDAFQQQVFRLCIKWHATKQQTV